MYLSPAPLYHSAPLFYCMSTMRLGGTVICMEAVRSRSTRCGSSSKYQVTHSQWVPTMFVRMLKLPEAERTQFDLSSHRCAIHAAAPCPVEIKLQMIEWWGPIIEEYYSATEGMGATYINSEQYLTHPGSVGKTMLAPIHIVDENGNDLPPGEIGTVYFEPATEPTRLRVPQGRGEDGGDVRRARLGDASATWATSTKRASSTSPTAARS